MIHSLKSLSFSWLGGHSQPFFLPTAALPGPLAVYMPLPGTNGDDLLTGGPGRDLLFSRNGQDTMDAGAGDDLMIGGDDEDTYVIDTTLQQSDIIYDNGTAPFGTGFFAGNQDAVQLEGFASSQDMMRGISVAVNGADLVLTYQNPATPGQSGEVTIKGQFSGNAGAVEILRAGNGTSAVDFHIVLLSGDQHTYSVHSGPDQGGEDLVLGTSGADEIYSGIGNDIVFGGAGRDHFMFNDEGDNGGGYDVILDFEDGRDVIDYTDVKTLTFAGVNITTSADGNALITTPYHVIELIGMQAADVTQADFAFF